jgi:putative chitinase
MDITKLKGHLPESIYDQLPAIIDKYHVNTNLRMSHFLGQCSEETGNFTKFEENLNYSYDRLVQIFPKYFPGTTGRSYAGRPERIANKVYGNRYGNGTEASGDGWKYRGRGCLQLTFKGNYSLLSKDFGVDFVKSPELVATEYSLVSAAWFFTINKVWPLCDGGSDTEHITLVTKKVNGGTINLDARINYFKKYWNILSDINNN